MSNTKAVWERNFWRYLWRIEKLISRSRREDEVDVCYGSCKFVQI